MPNNHASLGEFFKTYSEEHNISMRSMASKLEISPSYLSALISGKREMSQAFIDKFIKVSGVSGQQAEIFMEAALSNIREMKVDLANVKAKHRPVAAELTKAMEKFTDEDWKKFKRILEKQD